MIRFTPGENRAVHPIKSLFEYKLLNYKRVSMVPGKEGEKARFQTENQRVGSPSNF
jgi:hypothetical protein